MKRFAITSIIIASLAISNHSFAQVRLGLGSSARLSSAATVSTPSVSNALRASSAATHATAQATASTARSATATARTTTSTAKATTATTVSSNTQAINNTQVNADADVKVNATASAGAKNK
ncbi:MAG TPA: hypothetical protein VL727_11285 [Puia sp.]|nr:hypothetical protein [Puia sp.]